MWYRMHSGSSSSPPSLILFHSMGHFFFFFCFSLRLCHSKIKLWILGGYKISNDILCVCVRVKRYAMHRCCVATTLTLTENGLMQNTRCSTLVFRRCMFVRIQIPFVTFVILILSHYFGSHIYSYDTDQGIHIHSYTVFYSWITGLVFLVTLYNLSIVQFQNGTVRGGDGMRWYIFDQIRKCSLQIHCT